MAQTLLEKYAGIATSKGRSFLSKEEELCDVLLWQNQRDEKALERLIIDKALLVRTKISDLRRKFIFLVDEEDIDQWALEGIQKGIDAYPAGNTEISLTSYVVRGALWNVLGQIKPYFRHDKKMQYRADLLMRKESGAPEIPSYDYNGAEDLTVEEESRLQQAFNENIDNLYSTVFLDPYQALELKRKGEDIAQMLLSLNRQERNTIRMRFGLGITDTLSPEASKSDGGFMTFVEIADLSDLTPSRMRQASVNAIRKLQDPILSGHMAPYAEEDVPSPELGFEAEEPEEAVFNPFEGLFDAADGPDLT